MITLYPSFPSNFNMQRDPLFAKIDGLNVPLYLEKFERRGRAGAVVSFSDIDTSRRATELLSSELFAPEVDEDATESVDEEFTMEDLIGFEVDATIGDGVVYGGEITEFYDSRNPLFEVTFEGGREVLIPAAEEFIAGIDFEQRRIVFLLPEGLLEL